MPTNVELLEKVRTQKGDPYIYGAEADPTDPDPKAFDCSELVEWVCAQIGVKPKMPDGALYQFRHCVKHQKLIEVEKAIDTPGALLFRFSRDADPVAGEPEERHVAISQGDGTTFEARSKKYKIGPFPAKDRGWTKAALIPGLEYVKIE